MPKLEWKCVQEDYANARKPKPDSFTYRAKVPGGWLVAVWGGTAAEHGLAGGATFVPDQHWTWELDARDVDAELNAKKGS